MAVADVYSLVVQGEIHGQVTMNVLHYACTITGSANDADQLVAAWRAANETRYLACCGNDFQIKGYVCQKIHPLPVMFAFSQATDFLNGTGGVAVLPSSVSVVLTKRTLIGGKSGRGRIYMPAVPTVMTNESQITTGGFTTYKSLADQLNDPVTVANGGAYAPVLWHKTPRTYHVIVDVIPRTVLRNQRRRQVGRGV